jgi:hypothetical protein
MADLALPFVLAGLALFIGGGLVWFGLSTFNRPLPLRLAGGMIAGGAVLIGTGVLAWAVAA